jgi:hypothetical protein
VRVFLMAVINSLSSDQDVDDKIQTRRIHEIIM